MLRRPLAFLPSLAIALLAGCAGGDRLTQPEPEPAPTDYTDPAALVRAHAEALNTKDVARYAALLEAPQSGRSGFVFGRYSDLPWISGWAYDDEIRVVTNLFDPTWRIGDTGAGPVESVHMDVVPGEPATLQDGAVRIEVSADIRVSVAGWGERTFRPRLVFDLFPDDRGYLRIRRLDEQRPEGLQSGWGDFKSAFL